MRRSGLRSPSVLGLAALTCCAFISSNDRREHMRQLALATTMLCTLCAGTHAADQVKLGIFAELSGPISPAGVEIKRGVDLALEELGNKLGGLPVRTTV